MRRRLRERGVSVSEVKTQLTDGGLVDDSTAFVLGNAIRKLALCGTRTAEERVRAFSSLGVSYVAFLLAQEGPEDEQELGRLVSRFSS